MFGVSSVAAASDTLGSCKNSSPAPSISVRASLTSWCDFDIAGTEARIASLDAESQDSGFWDDAENARGVMQDVAALRAHVETWRGMETRTREVAELLELALMEEDESVSAAAEGELDAIATSLEGLEFQLQLSGEYDKRNAILAIHAGTGGTDAQDWADMLFRMYLRWAERRGFSSEVLDVTEGEEAGIKSATIEVKGPFAFGYLKSERGVHRLVRLSPYNASNLRQTSFAKVELMPEVEATGEIEVNPDDIRIDVYRASGHGGQNVQKNSTAIRITHIPSGIVVTCQNERSQGRNRESAMKVLEARLLKLEIDRKEEEKAKLKGKNIDTTFGSQIRNYVLHPYKMVKDLRTDFETSDTTAVLDGELDGFMEAYLKSRVGEEE